MSSGDAVDHRRPLEHAPRRRIGRQAGPLVERQAVEAQRADIAVQRRGGGAHLALGDLLPLGVGGVLELAHLVAELVDQLQAMGADDQLVDQPAEMLAVDAEMRQRLLVGADAPHVLQPVVGGLAGEALGAVLQHARRRRASGRPPRRRRRRRSRRDRRRRRSTARPGPAACRCGHWPRRRRARWRCGSRSRAAPNRRSAGRPSARRTAAAGCRSASPRSTVCTRSRFLARASPSAALWKPARRSTRRRIWTSSWPRTWARLIAGSQTGIRLFTR